MRFASPIYLLFLLLILGLVWDYIRSRSNRVAKIQFSDLESLKSVPQKSIRNQVLAGLRVAGLVLLILALARPQSGQRTEEVSSRGIDIMLCLDTSTSMRAVDFKPRNRLDAAKQAAREFIKGRKHDRIGVVVFSAMSFTQCPLTLDYGAVQDFLDKVEIGMTQTDGTAIGTAIATCINRLKGSVAKSKIIILLTDGRNNMGEIDPVTAAKAAQAMDIKIYTIGAGVPGGALYPVDDPVFGTRYVKLAEDLDENTLTQIAGLTGGLYFRATSSEGLKNIYKQIDALEKSELKIKEYTEYTELYLWFLIPALILLLLEIGLANTYFLKIP